MVAVFGPTVNCLAHGLLSRSFGGEPFVVAWDGDGLPHVHRILDAVDRFQFVEGGATFGDKAANKSVNVDEFDRFKFRANPFKKPKSRPS